MHSCVDDAGIRFFSACDLRGDCWIPDCMCIFYAGVPGGLDSVRCNLVFSSFVYVRSLCGTAHLFACDLAVM